jgi:hypothetical protein
MGSSASLSTLEARAILIGRWFRLGDMQCEYQHASCRQSLRGGQLQHVLLRYTQALITQISQTAVCNRLHSVEQRLCRWLLLCHDRAPGPEILMTQEFLANMLGGRRESVTVAAGHLQDAGLIHCSRGHITLVDRKGLEATVCECYKIIKDELTRLLGPRHIHRVERSLWSTR